MYGNDGCEVPQGALSPRQRTVLERLCDRREELQMLLDKTNQSIAFLEKNPEMEQFMNCIRDVNCL